MNVSDYLSHFPEKFPVSVNITTTAGELSKHKAMALVTGPPELELYFDANTLPDPERIDTGADCLVFVETGEIVTLICAIDLVEKKGLLRVTAHDVIQHVEKREFFRGPATRLALSCRPKGPEGGRPFSAKGVNISCGGMLLMMTRQLRQKEKLVIDIEIPEPVKKVIQCDAVVLRVNPLRSNTYFTAVRFTNMDSEICDDIMAFCFAEQRRILREQVLTRDL